MEIKEAGGLCRQTDHQNAVPISEYEFRLIRDHIHDYCGIYFDDAKMSTLASRLTFRLRLLDIGNFSEYYNFLKYNPRSREEMDDLIPHLTNNETYFFREMSQLSVFTGDVLDRVCRAKSGMYDRTVNVVSCGCSSGEEAYTIAMLLDEGGHYKKNVDIRITGVDIDRKVIEKATRGVYTSYSLRATERPRIDRYFAREGDRYTLDESIRQRVRFIRGNLMDRRVLGALQRADVIFCRNVLIYFSDRSIRSIAEIFHESLAPHGFLFLGHSESLSRVTDIFVPRRYPNAIIYCKKDVY